MKMCSTEVPTNNHKSGTGNVTNDSNNNNMDTTTTVVSTVTVPSPTSPTSINNNNNRNPNRRSNKPIMEKRRRARINNCLNELKAILLEAMKKDPARHSKLEKADILEMTVSHLQSLHKNGLNTSSSDNLNKKFREGFTECASEVNRFLNSPKATGISSSSSQRLMSHLSDCMLNMNDSPGSHSPPLPLPFLCTTGPPSHNHNEQQPHNNLLGISPNGTGPIHISLVPSRLSSGEIAFVVPANALPGGTSQLPIHKAYSQNQNQGMRMSMLSPSDGPLELTMHSAPMSSSCPTATSSPSSTTSSLSPVSYLHHSHSQSHPPPTHHPYYHQPHYHSSAQQGPLALVTPRYQSESESPLDMSCWRPW